MVSWETTPLDWASTIVRGCPDSNLDVIDFYWGLDIRQKRPRSTTVAAPTPPSAIKRWQSRLCATGNSVADMLTVLFTNGVGWIRPPGPLARTTEAG